MFQCQEVRQNNIFLDKNNLPDSYTKSPCLIAETMQNGQNAMQAYFETKTIYWLYDEVYNHQFTPEQRQRTVEWFQNHSW